MRKLLIILLCSTVTLLAGYVGLRTYRAWKQKHMMALARQFAAKSDLRSAALAAAQVLNSNPQNLDACRLMAELSESIRSPESVLWRSRVVELNPNSTEDRLALVRAAIGLGDIITATNALAAVKEAGRNTAEYHIVAGIVAVAGRQVREAESQFQQACRLQPTNPVPRLNLAVLQLAGTNAAARNDARATLKQLTAEPSLGCQAYRELIGDAMRAGRSNEAIALSRQLVQQTNSQFADRLFQLEVLRVMRGAEFESTLALYRKEAAADPDKIYQMAAWQLAGQGPQVVRSWLEGLSATMQSNRVVQMVLAECRLRQQDWTGLQKFLQPLNWAELDFLRHASLSRAMRAQGLVSSADTEWQLAIKAANDRKENLVMLLRLADSWKWPNEVEELLWTFVNRFPEERWAFAALNQDLFLSGQTRSLMSLYGQAAQRDPSNLEMKNNLAMTALLLGAQELSPGDLAREVYQKNPTNANYASTYAFSLYLQKKDSEGLRIMRQLKPADLARPAVAGYYGLLLEAAGRNQEARTYLDRAARAPLLPEERALFARARAGLAGGAKPSQN